jgi:hypothetical protein
MLRRRSLVSTFHFSDHAIEVLALIEKYSSVPMSLADACLVRMSEVLSNPTLLTTDADFHIYKRHGRNAIPSAMPN